MLSDERRPLNLNSYLSYSGSFGSLELSHSEKFMIRVCGLDSYLLLGPTVVAIGISNDFVKPLVKFVQNYQPQFQAFGVHV